MTAAPFPLATLADIQKPVPHSLIGGPFGSKLVQKDYQPDGVPVIRGANLPGDQRFSFADFVFVSPAKVERDLRANRAFPGDIVVTQRGTLGQVGLIPRDSPFTEFVLSQSQMKLTVDDARVAADFVYYALRAPSGQHEIISRALTAGVPHINLAIFGEVRIPFPRLGIQRKIAAVLAAYDDLIENNRRRIRVLEEIPQRIYREWFVDFRDPGDRSVAAGDPTPESLPPDWRLTNLGDIADWFSGGTPPTRDATYWGGDIPWITSGSLTSHYLSSSERTLTELGARVGSRMVPRDAILFVVRGMSLAKEFRVGIADRPLAFGQDCKALLVHDELQPLLVLHSLIHRAPEIAKMVEFAAHGTGKISTDRLKDLPVVVPPRDLQERFASLAASVRAEVDLLTTSNHNLAGARDMLLPRLVSGELDVEGLDIFLEEAAA